MSFLGQLYKNSIGQVLLAYDSPSTSSNLTPAFLDKSSFLGNNVLYSVGNPVSCDETSHNFFNINTQNCYMVLNMNRVNDFVFPSLPSSRTNRYTMEGWIYVEISQQLTAGVNITWNNHLGISIIRDQLSATTIDVICFPQGYRDSLTGLNGLGVFTLYNSAMNKGMSIEDYSSSTWIFFRCAVDLQTGIFYISNGNSINIVNDTLYGSLKNVVPYRFFQMTAEADLSFFNMKLNNSRIFFRSFNVYRDFIPQALINLKYRDMFNFASSNFWPLVFNVDFDKYTWVEPITYLNYLNYTLIDEKGNVTTPKLTTLLVNLGPINYSTYPKFYPLKLCDVSNKGDGNNNCVPIKGVGLTCLPTEFCFDLVNSNLQKFWCPTSNYIDISNYSCSPNCPTGYTRLPDSIDSLGY